MDVVLVVGDALVIVGDSQFVVVGCCLKKDDFRETSREFCVVFLGNRTDVKNHAPHRPLKLPGRRQGAEARDVKRVNALLRQLIFIIFNSLFIIFILFNPPPPVN
jgi:hypothetical protein